MPYLSTFKKSIIVSLLLIMIPVAQGWAISIPQEYKLGKEFMEMIQKQDKIINDPIANHMVKGVGKHILSFLPAGPFTVNFYLVDEDVFNAFAAPAANIFLYRGLITSLDSIDEMAGIIGHEIAHAVSRHVSESIDRAKYISIGSLAGILAGAIIGSNSEGDAGSAVIQGSLAVGQTAMLAFTRENETEADEKGIMFLKKTCFSPYGLQSGLMKIQAADFKGFELIPEYVKTHPGTANRIAHVETILSDEPRDVQKKCPEDYRFDMVKQRLVGLYSGDVSQAMEKTMADLKEDPSDPSLHYGMGLLYARKMMREKALDHFRQALSVNIFDPMVLLEMGRVFLLDGNPEKAIELLKGVQSHPVMGIMARFHLGQAYFETGRYTEARNYLKTVINKEPALYPKSYYTIANILSDEGRQALAAFYLGQYYYYVKNYKNAKHHLTNALELTQDSVFKEKINRMLEKISKTRS